MVSSTMAPPMITPAVPARPVMLRFPSTEDAYPAPRSGRMKNPRCRLTVLSACNGETRCDGNSVSVRALYGLRGAAAGGAGTAALLQTPAAQTPLFGQSVCFVHLE